MERLSGPGGGKPGGSRRKSAAVLIACGVAALAAAWLMVVLLLGGEAEQTARREPRQADPEITSLEETTPHPLGAGEGARSGGTPESRYVERGGEKPGTGGSGGKSGRDLPEGGASNEPGGYDPLGTGASPGDLSPTERGRVERAVGDYILYAFGYTGADRAEYTSAVNLAVVNPEFYETPGAAAVGAFSESVAEGGAESEARLEDFEMEEQSLQEVAGVARFSMDGSEGSGDFEQRLTLVKWGAGWKVRAADPMRRIEDRRSAGR